MIETPRFQHTADMGEISGFGGSYEAGCQAMLDAGVRWLKEHADKAAKVQVLVNPHIYGIIKEGTPETEELSKIIVKASDNDCTGAMHHAVMARLSYIASHSWEKYCGVLVSTLQKRQQ